MIFGPAQRRCGGLVGVFAVLVLVSLWLNVHRLQETSFGSKLLSPLHGSATHDRLRELRGPVETYFEQVFSFPEEPPAYEFPALKEYCDVTYAEATGLEDVYLECRHFFAGITSVMSEVKTCLKMAMEAGTGLVLPKIPLRDSTDLKQFNFGVEDKYYPYEQWFDAEHLIKGLNRACPKMKVLYGSQVEEGGDVKVEKSWDIDVARAPGYREFQSHFWSGRPFKEFFDFEIARLREEEKGLLQTAEPAAISSKEKRNEGITVITMPAVFLLFRITDDPTGNDLRLWNDLGSLVRFLEKPRRAVERLLRLIERPYYGVHFRVESDTIWSPLETQLAIDLDALDAAWAMEKSKGGKSPSGQKPLVYLACGDEGQMQKFKDAGKERGWEVTHKWDVVRASGDKETLDLINELPFDFQGAVDMGMLLMGGFFIGISGSALSSTVANARDVTGRYRGSSLRKGWDDEGAGNYLSLDGGPSSYPCCL